MIWSLPTCVRTCVREGRDSIHVITLFRVSYYLSFGLFGLRIICLSDYSIFGFSRFAIVSTCNCFILRCSHFEKTDSLVIVLFWIGLLALFQFQFCRIGWPYFCPFFAFELGFVYYRLKIFSLIFSQLRSNVKIYLHLSFDRRNIAKQSGNISHIFHSLN